MSTDQILLWSFDLAAAATLAAIVVFELEIRRRAKRDAQPFTVVWHKRGIILEESQDETTIRLRDEDGDIICVHERITPAQQESPRETDVVASPPAETSGSKKVI